MGSVTSDRWSPRSVPALPEGWSGKPKKTRPPYPGERLGGALDPARQGPWLAAPTLRSRRGLDDGQTAVNGAGDIGGAVAAVVIDDDDLIAAGIILGHQGAHRAADQRRFVAGGYDNRDIRPLAASHSLAESLAESLVGAPESAAKKNQIKPYDH